MKKVKFKYFVNGVETEFESVDWKLSTNIKMDGDVCHITIPLVHSTATGVESNKEYNYQEYKVCDTAVDSNIGVKHNSLKAPLDIVINRQFPKALQILALATAFGNKKYEATDKDFLNFKRVAGGSQTYFDAAARHNAQRNEEDKDSLLPHLVHAVWNMLASLEITIEENDIDVQEYSKMYLEYLHN